MGGLLICRLGKAEIYRLPQGGDCLYPAEFFFPGLGPERVLSHADQIPASSVDRETWGLHFAFQAFLIKLPDIRIVIDPPFGNHKSRPGLSRWHLCDMPFIDHFAGCGISPDEVDLVASTHLHADHVGWNTKWVDGAWAPTFSRARYFLPAGEIARLEEPQQDERVSVADKECYLDSVLPLADAGRIEFLPSRSTVARGDGWSLTYEPAFGHTAAHSQLILDVGGNTAIFCGDAVHHPIEVVASDLCCAFDEFPSTAREFRASLIERCAQTGSILIPAHFTFPVAGRIGTRQSGYECRPLP